MCINSIISKINILKSKIKLIEKEINEIDKKIHNYRILGDLSENPEYQISKKKKYSLENELKSTEKSIDMLLSKTIIRFKEVRLKNLKTNKIITCNSNSCSDFFINLNLINEVNYKNLNDIINIKIYNKKLSFKIVSIKYK